MQAINCATRERRRGEKQLLAIGLWLLAKAGTPNGLQPCRWSAAFLLPPARQNHLKVEVCLWRPSGRQPLAISHWQLAKPNSGIESHPSGGFFISGEKQ
jgi:hypothetical protein